MLDSSGAMGLMNSTIHAFNWTNLIQNELTSHLVGMYARCWSYAGFAFVDGLTDAIFDNILGHGTYCFYNASFRLSNESYVLLRARLAGYNSYFYCDEGYNCVVDCRNHSTACYGVTFDCETIDTCTVQGCNESIGIWCPIGWWQILQQRQVSDSNVTLISISNASQPQWEYLEIDEIFEPVNFDILSVVDKRATTVTVTPSEAGGGQKILKKTLPNVTLGVWGS